jgi:hypothetical protein
VLSKGMGAAAFAELKPAISVKGVMALKSFLVAKKQGAMRGLRFAGSQRSYALHSNRVDMQVGNEGVPHFAQACGLTWIGSASLDDQPADVQISLPAGSAARRLGGYAANRQPSPDL